jgi:hypothetical protein
VISLLRVFPGRKHALRRHTRTLAAIAAESNYSAKRRLIGNMESRQCAAATKLAGSIDDFRTVAEVIEVTVINPSVVHGRKLA